MFFFLVMFASFLRTLRRALTDAAFRGLLTTVTGTLLIGTFFYHFVEDWGYLDSLYFTVITLTTVGYGDLSPDTALGKTFTIFYVLLGVGLIVSFVTTLASRRTRWFGMPPPEEREEPGTAR